MRTSLTFLLIAAIAGCGGENNGTEGTPAVPGAKPAPREGYQRYESTPVMLGAGRSMMIVQWVAPPVDRDMDIVDIVGWQSKGGHHAILYATSDQQPVGTVRNWKNDDQISSKFLGGNGGEGGGAIKLPAGVVVRLPKGYGLILQLHYLNTASTEVMGESLIDVKMVDASPDHRLASFFTSTNLMYEVAPQQKTTLDIMCQLKSDVPMLMFANHQHEMGLGVYTEEIRPDGTRTDLKRDDTWKSEWTFNPNFTHRSVDSPLVLKAGDTLHTHCEWMNTTSRPVRFPDEMCVFLGYFLGDQEINCPGKVGAN
jgi:hypothetical protein